MLMVTVKYLTGILSLWHDNTRNIFSFEGETCSRNLTFILGDETGNYVYQYKQIVH